MSTQIIVCFNELLFFRKNGNTSYIFLPVPFERYYIKGKNSAYKNISNSNKGSYHHKKVYLMAKKVFHIHYF